MKKYVRCADGLDSVNEFAVDKLLRKKPRSVTDGPRRYVWAVFFNAGYTDIPLFVDPGAYGYNCKLTWVNDKEKFESDSAELKEAAEELGIPLSAHWGVGKPYVTIPYHRRHDASGYDEAKDEDAIRESSERAAVLSKDLDSFSTEELRQLDDRDAEAIILRGYKDALNQIRKKFKKSVKIKPEPAGIHTKPKVWSYPDKFRIDIELFFIPEEGTDVETCYSAAEDFVSMLESRYSKYDVRIDNLSEDMGWRGLASFQKSLGTTGEHIVRLLAEIDITD